MPVINVRELARSTSSVISAVSRTRRPTLVTRGGKPVVALVPLDSDDLEDWILANAPEFVRSRAEAEADLREGRVMSLETYLGSRALRPDTSGPTAPERSRRARAAKIEKRSRSQR